MLKEKKYSPDPGDPECLEQLLRRLGGSVEVEVTGGTVHVEVSPEDPGDPECLEQLLRRLGGSVEVEVTGGTVHVEVSPEDR
nr:albeferon [synthetic construct]